MTLADVIEKAPIVLAQIAACSAALGGFGTALEAAGEALKLPKLVAIGQRLEAIFADLPKLIRGSRYTALANG